jgi:excisionase family DNA binding protein
VSLLNEDELRRVIREEAERVFEEREAQRAEVRRWLSVAQAADYLASSEAAIRARIERGTLPVRRLGSRVLIDRDELDRILERS